MGEAFDKYLQVRAPGRLLDQLDTAAAARMVDRSDYVRNTLIEKLRADGIGAGMWGMTVWSDVLNAPKAEH